VLYRGTQHVPEFYQQAVSGPRQETAQQAGDELERRVLNVQASLRREGRWSATFTDEQVNGWLTFHLPNRLRYRLPAGLADPRVQVTPGLIQAAVRYEGPRLQSVVSLEAQVHLTERPNEVALRIRRVRAGWVPLPLGQTLDQVAEAAQRGGLDLRWTQTDGDPVALIRLPAEHPEFPGRDLQLESIELGEGSVTLSGTTRERRSGG
jgi:hypothetical protein